jgi:dUTPase
MNVKIQLLHKDAKIPQKATTFAGGWDVTCTEIIHESDDYVRCKLGFALQPPPNYRVMCHARSSITKTKWFLCNGVGLGDADYLNEYELRFRCLPDDDLQYEDFPYRVGDRVGQIYLEEVIPIEFEEVTELKPLSERKGGFGSTGLN